MIQIINDEDLSTGEQIGYLVDWILLEMSFARRNHLDKVVEKHGRKVNATIDILNFRKEMSDL